MRYFFHVFNGAKMQDTDGTEFADESDAHDHARDVAVLVLRAASAANLFKGVNWVVGVEDQTGKTVYNLRLSAEGGSGDL